MEIRGDNGTDSHYLFDTLRGVTKYLETNTTDNNSTDTASLTDFNTDGFTTDSSSKTNLTGTAYVAWTFRKARRFFEVAEVTKTSGTDATVNFASLGTLGMVVVKLLTGSGSWYVWHKDLTAGKLLYLEQTAAEATLGHITVSGTTVTLEDAVIADGDYIVYAWAHDTNSRGVVQCGSYTGNGSATGPEIDLGWRPQYLMVKRSTGGTANWYLYDNQRSPANPRNKALYPDSSSSETTPFDVDFLINGFQPKSTSVDINASGSTYIYLAIREE